MTAALASGPFLFQLALRSAGLFVIPALSTSRGGLERPEVFLLSLPDDAAVDDLLLMTHDVADRRACPSGEQGFRTRAYGL